MVLFFWFYSLALGNQTKFPQIENFHGQVLIEAPDIPHFRLKTDQVLKGKIRILTGSESQISVRMPEGSRFILGPNTEVLLPGVSTESGQVSSLEIVQGQLRLRGGPLDIPIKSSLFGLSWSKGDYVLIYDSKNARTEILALEGQVEFEALGRPDTRILLNPQEKTFFQGEIENGEVAHDILLAGKRVARGLRGPRTALSDEDKEKWSAAEEKRQEELRKKARRKQEEEHKKKLEKWICKEPRGEFNQCSWTCEGKNSPQAQKTRRLSRPQGDSYSPCPTEISGVFCIRQRCLATGEWGDALRLDPKEGRSKCREKSVVQTCDY